MVERPLMLRPQRDFIEINPPLDSGVLFSQQSTETGTAHGVHKEHLINIYFCGVKWVKVDSWTNSENKSQEMEKSFTVGFSDSTIGKKIRETDAELQNLSVSFGDETKMFSREEYLASGGKATAKHTIGAGETIPVYQREYKLHYIVETQQDTNWGNTGSMGFSDEFQVTENYTAEHDVTIKSNEFRYDHPRYDTEVRMVEMLPIKPKSTA